MSKRVLILNGSPKKRGNTSLLVSWFADGCRSTGAAVEIVECATLDLRNAGCVSCRACQKLAAYECAFNDDGAQLLKKMPQADVLVFATPLYFFSASAQLKVIVDRMFSLYKWDNASNTMRTPLAGKTLVLLASAYEDVGLDALEKPFALTAAYTKMGFRSLLVPNAGVSGDIEKLPGIREKAAAFGAETAR
jgi:multimeric flavodoxin WrbA